MVLTLTPVVEKTPDDALIAENAKLRKGLEAIVANGPNFVPVDYLDEPCGNENDAWEMGSSYGMHYAAELARATLGLPYLDPTNNKD